MSRQPYRYQTPKSDIATVIDVVAKEITPLPVEVERAVVEAESKGRAEEALAVASALWDDLTALEDTKRKAGRRRTPITESVLIDGQIMGIKGALGRHLNRHRPKGGK